MKRKILKRIIEKTKNEKFVYENHDLLGLNSHELDFTDGGHKEVKRIKKNIKELGEELKVLKSFLLLCSILIFVSCGKIDDTVSDMKDKVFEKIIMVQTTTDEEFVEYTESFFDSQYKHTGETSDRPAIVNFGKVNPDARATCWTRADHKKEVMIDREIWNTLSDIHRRLLIFHELGHCVLDRDHSWKFIYNEDEGVTIMASIMFSNTGKILNKYIMYQDAYEYELFTGNASMIEEEFGGIQITK